VGAGADALETDVSTLALSAGSGGAYLSESSGLTVDTLAVTVNRLDLDGSSSAQSAGGEDLTVTGGTLALNVLSGDLTVNAGANASAGVNATGNTQVRLSSAAGALTLNAAVNSESGAISLLAATDLTLAGGGDIVSSGGTVDLLATSGAVQMASGEGEQRSERSITAGGDVRVQAGTSIGLGLITAVDQNVALIAGASITDGDSAVDIIARGLSMRTGDSGGVGNLGDALEVRLDESLGGLGADVGSAGLYLHQDGALRVTDLQSQGAVMLAAADDILLGRLDAAGQAVTLTTAGSVLADSTINLDNAVRVVAAALVVNANGLGTSATALVADVDTLDASAGTGGVFFQALDSVRVLNAKGEGPLEVSAPQGAFEVTTGQSFDTPITVVSAEVVVSALLSGPSINLQPPSAQGDGGEPLALVIGTPVSGVTPGQGVFLGVDEVANLQFADIVLGSSQPGQEIWLQTKPNEPSDRLVFSGDLTLNATHGDTYFAGQIDGVGLTVNGSGRTTHFQGVDMWHSQRVTINDALDVTADSILELADTDLSTHLVLTINGNITVREGQTLQLLADEIVFGGAMTIVLEDGATLVLGGHTITVGLDVAFDSDGGHLVLRGAPSAVALTNPGLMQVDFAPDDWRFSAGATDALVLWLAADADGDDGLATLTLGDVSATTRVASPSIWNGLTVGSVLLRGDVVHLGTAGDAAWTLQHDAVMRATHGDLRLHVDLLAEGDLSLVSNSGAVSMDAGTQITGQGAVALTAATGIAVGQIEADQRIDLFSPAGRVQAVAALVGLAHLDAPAMSFYGYGLALPVQSGQAVLVVDAQALQVGAPTGGAARGYAADGSVYYRLMDKGVVYHQLQVFDQAPQRVMVPRSELQAQAAEVAQSRPLAGVWADSSGWSGWSLNNRETPASSTSAVARYLSTEPIFLLNQSFGSNFDPFGGDEIDLIDYGLTGDLGDSGLLLDASSDLLRSTGQLLAASQWSIEANDW
jgi:hypothetical protein